MELRLLHQLCLARFHRLIVALVLQLSPQPIGGSAGLLVAPALQATWLLLPGRFTLMCSIELIGEFRLAAVLQAKADAVARRGIKPIKAGWAVIQHQHARVPGNLHLCNQRDQAYAGRSTQGFWLSFGSVPLISRLMLLRWRQSTSSIATRATTKLALLLVPAAISSGRLIAANTLASDT